MNAEKSDLEKQSDEEGGEPKKSSGQILKHEVSEALVALDRSFTRLFCSGISAGLDVGFSLFFIAILHTAFKGREPEPLTDLILATTYSFGFIIVVIGRSELFTEQTSLAVLPLLSGNTSIKMVARLWAIVYVANVIGAAGFAALAVVVGPALGVIDIAVFGEISEKMVSHDWWVIFASGVLAGWLMGLLSWLVAAGRDTISQIFIVWLITTGIGLGHLHHCVLGTVEVLAGVFSGSETSMADFGHFLLWATVGNAIGGPFFVALLKYGHARIPRSDLQEETDEV